MSAAKRVLMIGGPADGRWMTTDGYSIIVAKPPVFDWKTLSEDPLSIVELQRVLYSVQTCGLFGFRLDVAIAEGEFRSSRERDVAIARAVFQRDVAEAMGAV